MIIPSNCNHPVNSPLLTPGAEQVGRSCGRPNIPWSGRDLPVPPNESSQNGMMQLIGTMVEQFTSLLSSALSTIQSLIGQISGARAAQPGMPQLNLTESYASKTGCGADDLVGSLFRGETSTSSAGGWLSGLTDIAKNIFGIFGGGGGSWFSSLSKGAGSIIKRLF